jgi:hypothetical protein
MKKIAVVLFGSAGLLMSCENPIRLETKVHEDGSLNKTIVLEKTDSNRITTNMFGVNAETGWNVASELNPSEDSDKKFKIIFQKNFTSVEAANKELDSGNDSLFHIRSQFEKKFRWFYTYIRYSETFRPIDRFKLINPKDYFNLEDSLFINRLPGEGTAISKADSLFLQQLNDKIFDHFAEDALFGEYYSTLEEVVKRNTTDKKWLDTLARSKDFIYKQLDDMEVDIDFASKLVDSLGIPLPKEKSAREFAELSKEINSRINFMSFARDGKYTNIIDMPWTVVNSNADSVAGNKLYWRPLVTKFAIQEYTMFAESRRLNLWAFGVSLFVLGITVFLLIRTNRRDKDY